MYPVPVNVVARMLFGGSSQIESEVA
jgi:hypothetical protein